MFLQCEADITKLYMSLALLAMLCHLHSTVLEMNYF